MVPWPIPIYAVSTHCSARIRNASKYAKPTVSAEESRRAVVKNLDNYLLDHGIESKTMCDDDGITAEVEKRKPLPCTRVVILDPLAGRARAHALEKPTFPRLPGLVRGCCPRR